MSMTKFLKPIVLDTRPEYAWLLQAMQYNDSGATAKLPTNINWPLLVDLSEVHGLMPLLYQYLLHHHPENIPEDTLTDLEHRYKANELRNRLLVQELLKIMQCFESHDIRALAYKGPSLTISVYGDLALRQFGDLDILISADDVPKACELLTGQGYSRAHPPWSPAKERLFVNTHHEHQFTSSDQLVEIDLHWALSTRRFPFELKPGGLFERAEHLSMATGNIEHISAQDMLLLLCMHINKDLWRKLVWVCDIDRLVRTTKNIDWDSLLQESVSSHCNRMLYLALLISHELLQTPIPDSVLQSARAQGLATQAHNALELCLREEIPDRNYFQCLSIESYILSVCDSHTDQFKYIIRGLVRPTESDLHFNLPTYLHFLYYLVTPVRRIFFCTTRSIKRLLIG